MIIMAEVKVLIEGEHRGSSKEGGLYVSSTVTLIKSDKNIIVDAGSFIDKNKIIEALKKEGLTTEDINIIVLTHTHLDHTANTQLFKNAEAYLRHSGGNPGTAWEINSHKIRSLSLDNLEIAKDVKIIFTPGHTPDVISVVVKTDKGTIVVAGDAVMAHEGKLVEPTDKVFCWNLEKLRESRKKIIDMADYVIPGHCGLIEVEK